MKKLILFLLLPMLTCCNDAGDEFGKQKSISENATVIEIDGCEYIQYKENTGTQYGIYSLTHKGNCKNKIHIYK